MVYVNPKSERSIYDDPPRYYAFLLTAWEERGQKPAEKTVWRFSLEDTRTNRRRGFATLEELVTALKALLGNAEAAEAVHREAHGGVADEIIEVKEGE